MTKRESHTLAHNIIRERFGEELEGSVLDVGCGKGKARGSIGIDLDGGDIKGDAYHLPFKDNSFDTVSCCGLLHHIGLGCIREFARVARKEVVVCEPNLFHLSGILMNVFNSLFPGITGLDPKERALSPLRIAKVFEECDLLNVRYSAASHVWNRLPLFINRLIVKYERPTRLFGWWEIVRGMTKQEEIMGG